jgi:hypothetical protein
MATLRRNFRPPRDQPKAPANPYGNQTGEKNGAAQRLIIHDKRLMQARKAILEPDQQAPDNQTNQTIGNHTDQLIIFLKKNQANQPSQPDDRKPNRTARKHYCHET